MSQNNPTIYIGIDVAKRSFVVHSPSQTLELTNDARGHTRLRRLLAKVAGPIHVVLEATGGYEQPIAAALHRAQIALSVVLPGRVRAYAKALGRRAKTDSIDAALLSAYGQAIQPLPTLPRSPREQALQEAVRQRQQLVEMSTQLKNQAPHCREARAKKRNQAMQAALRAQIAACQCQIPQRQPEDPQLQQRAQRLQEVPGVGPIVAAVLLAELPELGSLGSQEVAALAGVAPYNCDSGPWTGTRRIAGGRG